MYLECVLCFSAAFNQFLFNFRTLNDHRLIQQTNMFIILDSDMKPDETFCRVHNHVHPVEQQRRIDHPDLISVVAS